MGEQHAFFPDDSTLAVLRSVRTQADKGDQYLTDLLRLLAGACADLAPALKLFPPTATLRPVQITTGVKFPLQSLLKAAESVRQAAGGKTITCSSLFYIAVSSENYCGDEIDSQTVRVLAKQGYGLAGLSFVDKPPPPVPVGLGDDLTAMSYGWEASPLGLADDAAVPRYLQVLMVQLFGGYYTPVLVAEPGVGKTTLAMQIAYMLRSGDGRVNSSMHQLRVVGVSRSHLMSGTADRGQLEERVRQLVDLAHRDNGSIVFFDEMHSMFDSSREGTIISNILKPPMAAGQLRCFGATTREEYDRILSSDPALADRLSLIPLPEPTRDAVVANFKRSPQSVLKRTGQTQPPRLTDDAIQAAVDLTIRYLPLQRLPRKAANLIRTAAAELHYDNPKATQLTGNDVRRTLEKALSMPEGHLTASVSKRAGRLRELICMDVKGHDEAVSLIANYIMAGEDARARGALQHGPIASIFLVGPSGVGKRTLAWSIARHHFANGGAERDVISEIDVDGFDGETGINRLRGAPPGYVGYEETRTSIYSDVRASARRLVLIRGVDRSKGLAALLRPILEEGTGADGRGRPVSFAGCVLILTAESDQQGDAAALRESVDLKLDLQLVEPLGLAEIAAEMSSQSSLNSTTASEITAAAKSPKDIVRAIRLASLRIH
ncbi:AAA family ATPase [Humisphaera borealis]|uniref:ATP-dependent Clp protease ATP-binding subunit n=1 Tax=Humisphaera borealis TaxID=2807512 RepID=A0A7M2WXD6_9BACT|nr:AAA family ATPase [Humisphaera borealis]QOV90187.1 ATP-dependent Clp protease ATP-binding subunit [Humisphaera borealis]